MFLSDDFVILAVAGALLRMGATGKDDQFMKELGSWIFAVSIVFFGISALFDYTTAPDPIITAGYLMLACSILVIFILLKFARIIELSADAIRSRR